MRDLPLIINSHWSVPPQEIEWRGIRSGGPGGQNVNKVNSKVELRWNVAASRSVPEIYRERIRESLAQRISAAGEIIIVAGRFRDQPRNLEDALLRLTTLLKTSIVRARPRRVTKVSRSAKQRRREEKSRVSRRKAERRRSGADE